MDGSEPVGVLSGVGPKKQKILEDAGMGTVGSLLARTPVRYEDRTEVAEIACLSAGRTAQIEAVVERKRYYGYRYGRKSPLTLTAADATGSVEIVFFQGSYIAPLFHEGDIFVFYGMVTENRGRLQMIHPEFCRAGSREDVRGIFPVYSLPEGISQNLMRRLVRQALNLSAAPVEWIPADVRGRFGIPEAAGQAEALHFPKDRKQMEAARRRVMFEDVFALETGMAYLRADQARRQGVRIRTEGADFLFRRLPFSLTAGQKKVWGEIASDLESDRAMNRLVQGDVGSGKTVLAEAALYCAADSGYQSVLMAPTEILARQHLETLTADLAPLGLTPALLTGSMTPQERADLLGGLADGSVPVLIATHAVLQPDVRFHNLGLVITDEQHRFGVEQRRTLTEKGHGVNVLVMTATPIPRTLAVVLYGDLSLSVIDTMPEGRKKIQTYVVTPAKRDRAYGFVADRIEEGRQCYVVTPLIEESDMVDARSAEQVYEELTARFPRYQIALLHGRQKQDEKEAVMQAFSEGRVQILVSTVVIEVGIHVPNATVMVIENCERFGLAQMHQLRGRVGRGSIQSYCLLMLTSRSETAVQRAKVMKETSDGFEIAEQDLRLRGPGELLGTRQHGLPEIPFEELAAHPDVLADAEKAAKMVLSRDPDLSAPEDQPLRKRTEALFHGSLRIAD